MNTLTIEASADINVTGQMGLYELFVVTPQAFAWVKANFIHPRADGSVTIEGGQRCREIVAAAVRAGLRVTVNGIDMKGFGQ